MRGAFHHTISQPKSERPGEIPKQIVAGPRAQRFPLISSPKETSLSEKVRL